MSVPGYESYRDSGIDWIGEVPAKWEVAPLKAAFSVVGGATPKSDVADYWDGGIPWVTPGDLSRLETPFLSDTIRTISEDGLASCAATRVPAGSVILSTRAPIGSLGITTEPSTTNQGCKALVPRHDTDPQFLAYMLSIATTALNVRGKGTTFLELSGDELARFKVPLPSTTEQTAIVAFLDRETGKIDALVEAQRRLIELLKEKRQSVISHAVAKGLDPAAPMKDSGVEWLGEVPAHWEVRRLSTEASFFQGKAHEPFVEDDGEHICVTARFVSTAGEAQKNCTQNLSPAKRGDILMVMSDLPNGRALARAFLVSDDRSYAVNQRVCSIRFEQGSADFFAYQLNRNKQLLQFNDGVEQTHLKNSAFTKLFLAIPPVAEQQAIARWLDQCVAAWDRLTDDAELATAFLQERRAALISAAVTGKIDVRSLVAEKMEAA